jgi:hypothetical protein
MTYKEFVEMVARMSMETIDDDAMDSLIGTARDLLKEDKQKVWVLTVAHKHGTNVSAHKSEDSAYDELFAFVDQWWQHELSRSMPVIQGEAINQYFEATDEAYEITECAVED